MKRFYVFCVIFLSLSSWIHIASAQNVSFSDTNLAATVRTNLGLAVGDPIPEASVAGMLSLTASGLSISDLTGLEYATSLTGLDLSDNSITNISALEDLTSLVILDLAENSITDISALEDLTSLILLGLSENSITDISALEDLTRLEDLYLSDNSITDISALEDLTRLEYLNLSNNSITDISALEGLTNLEDLYLSGNSITDFNPVAWLSSLTTVDFTIPFVVRMNNVPAGVQTGAFTVGIEFNMRVTDFTAGDIGFGTGSVAAQVTSLTGSGTTYTATITPTEQGTLTFKVPENVAFVGTVGNTASLEASVTVDLPPRVTEVDLPPRGLVQVTYPTRFSDNLGLGPRVIGVTVSFDAPTDDAIIVLQVTFSEDVSGFDATDIVLAGDADARVSDLTSVSQSVYSIEVTITNTGDGENDGSITVEIPASAVEDIDHTPEGNTAYASETANESVTIYYVPYLLVKSSSNYVSSFHSALLDPQNGPFDIILAFNEPMSGFTQQDFFSQLYTNTAQATITNWTANADRTEYTAEFTPTTDGSLGAVIVAGDFPAVNQHGIRVQHTFGFAADVDMTQPQVTLSNVPTGVQNAAFTVNIEFTEDVTGFEAADISLTGTASASVTSFTAGNASEYAAEITPTTEGTVVIQVPADAAEDAATNGNVVSSGHSVTVDPVPPTVTIDVPSGQQSSVFEATVEFSESVTGFAISDISLTGTASATVTALTGSGSTYAAEITSTSNGTVILQVPANTVEDIGSNQNTASPSYTVQIDVTLPGVSLTGVPATPQNGVFNVSIEFTEDVTGFAASDISLTGAATATATLTGSGSTYAAEITPTAEGDLVIQVPANSAIDVASNQNTASPARTVTIDLTRPGVSLTGVPATPQNGVFEVSIVFTEDVTGFAASDISLTGAATATATLTGSGSTYAAEITPTTEGDLVIQVPANSTEDAATNQNTASLVHTVAVDQTRPDVAVDVPAAPQSAPFTVNITFTEPVTGFEIADIDLTGTAAATVTDFTGSGSTYTAEIASELNVAGNVIIQVPASIAEDAATNQNTASLIHTVAVDRTFPEVAIDVPSDPQSAPFDVTITFSEVVSDFDQADLTLSGTATASITAWTATDNTVFTATITPTTEGSVIIRVPANVAQDTASNANAASDPQSIDVFPAWMPNANLRTVVREALGLPENTILRQEELLDLTVLNTADIILDVADPKIDDLRGLEYATELIELYLDENAISDISSVAALTQLEVLSLNNNLIEYIWHEDSDDNPFIDLTQLTKLSLDGNLISDMSPLEALPQLAELSLNRNLIEDISTLEALTQLTVLSLNENPIDDFMPLEGLTELTHLSLNENSIDDISFCAALTQLKVLSLENNEITGVSFLAGLENLETVKLSENPISDTTPLIGIARHIETDEPTASLISDEALAEILREIFDVDTEEYITYDDLRSLTELEAPDSDIIHLDGLEHATELETLDLRGNTIEDIARLKGLTKLTILDLGVNSISNINTVAELTKLIELYLEENLITDITPLLGLVNLEILQLTDNPIVDARPLASLTDVDIDIDVTVYLVTVPDDGLAGALREALDLDVDDGIPSTQLMALTTLDARDRQISNLSGLEHATALTELDLRDNAITDVKLLAALVNLKTLRLTGNPIQDVGPLADLTADIEADIVVPGVIPDTALAAAIRDSLGLPSSTRIKAETLQNLKILDVQTDAIETLTGLERAVNLATLIINGGSITDITALQGLTQLTTLEINSDAITDITALQGLTQLTTLKINGGSITDIIALQALTQLAVLELRDNAITDITPLSELITLTTLDLSGNSISSIGALEKLTGLTMLNLSGNSIISIDGLQKLTALMTLNLSNNSITSIDGFEVEMDLAALEPGDITPAQGLTGLTVLDLSDNSISSIDGLQDLTNLEMLGLSNNSISSIRLLQGLTGLTVLDLSGNSINNIDALQNLTRLTTLDLSANDFSDIQSLQGLITLRQLSLTSNNISDASSLARLVNLELLRLAENPIMDTSPLFPLVTTHKLVDVDIEISQWAPWDVNQDGSVNDTDFGLVATAMGQTAGTIVDPRTDVNGDGIVDRADLLLVTEHLSNEVAGAPSVDTIVALLGSSILKSLDYATLKTELNRLIVESDGSLKYQRAIEYLQNFLLALRPDKTRLLANYPNPFNPETWIPYHLADAGDVELIIYSMQGSVVRRLALGHQQAGYYVEKNRAAYWDGRNVVGERVASGIYFYQLQTDNMSALRKMVILK